MAFKQVFSLLTAVLLVAASGCSGSRMRNLISRSDYMTVEELEAQDAFAAEREEAARAKALAAVDTELDGETPTERLVARSRTIDSAADDSTGTDEEEADSSGKGFLNIAGLFKKNREESEISPDPFVEVAEPDAVKKAKMARESPDVSNVAATSDKAAQQYEKTLQSLEKEAESVFDEVSPVIVKASKVIDTVAEFEDIKAQDRNTGDSQVDSAFADYMELRNKEARTVFADPKDSAPKSAATFEAAAESAASKFDAILADTSRQESQSDSAFSSELFPGLDDLTPESSPAIKQDKKTESAASIFDRFAGADSNDAAGSAFRSDDPFVQASEKHGFANLNQRDPWAAFNSDGGLTQPHQNSTGDDGFVWANQRNGAVSSTVSHPQSSPESKGFDFPPIAQAGAGTSISEPLTPPSPFKQISSSEVASTSFNNVVPEIAESPGLMIPTGNPQPVSLPSPAYDEFQGSGSTDLDSSNPFPDTSFVEASPEEVADDAAVETTANASSMPFGLRWSTRSWFLLIGCALVIALFILPDRQNRFNA